ncbi:MULTISPECIES: TIGR01244 family sulfur transferase [Shewanella]|jgi:sulfide:quinone oxidoreductase|uniref:TIGR01244 family sulfur transferase n=1 Tax=Shewanella indica TaxID=768528 RepID=A0ABU4QF09_9GAMM|nr:MULTISPECIES: TIGR01244 family sulfur transferase [Shewanella]MDX6017448.1 TIGR01244 family sulfur transferase [Shewanella indica]OIN16345.1 TIGR01244 family protein [Shewanella algae]TVP13908.1 TIGR01244 family protein [Shewanella sp. MSW]
MLIPIYLTESITVSPQILPSDIPRLASMGFKSIINNRPDGEENDQPLNREIERLAKEQGMTYFHLPVISGNITQDQGKQFGQFFMHAPKPILAFCRTGTRCSALWSMSCTELGSFDRRIAQATKMGFDLSWVKQPD